MVTRKWSAIVNAEECIGKTILALWMLYLECILFWLFVFHLMSWYSNFVFFLGFVFEYVLVYAALSNSVLTWPMRNCSNISTRWSLNFGNLFQIISWNLKFNVKSVTYSMCSRWSKKNIQKKKLTGVILNLLIIRMFLISLRRCWKVSLFSWLNLFTDFIKIYLLYL